MESVCIVALFCASLSFHFISFLSFLFFFFFQSESINFNFNLQFSRLAFYHLALDANGLACSGVTWSVSRRVCDCDVSTHHNGSRASDGWRKKERVTWRDGLLRLVFCFGNKTAHVGSPCRMLSTLFHWIRVHAAGISCQNGYSKIHLVLMVLRVLPSATAIIVDDCRSGPAHTQPVWLRIFAHTIVCKRYCGSALSVWKFFFHTIFIVAHFV